MMCHRLADCLSLSVSLSSKYCQQPRVDAEQIHPWAETGEKTPFTARALEKEEFITVIYS